MVDPQIDAPHPPAADAEKPPQQPLQQPSQQPSQEPLAEQPPKQPAGDLYGTLVEQCLHALAGAFPDDERLQRVCSSCGRAQALGDSGAHIFRHSLGSRPDLIAARDPALFSLFRDVHGFNAHEYYNRATEANREVAWEWLRVLDDKCPLAPLAADVRPESWSPEWAVAGQDALPPLSQLTDVLQQVTSGPQGAEFGKVMGSMVQMMMSGGMPGVTPPQSQQRPQPRRRR